MSYDRYQLSEPVTENSHVFAPKGVMVVGTSTAVLHPRKKNNYASGVTAEAFGGFSGAAMTITGSAQGNIFPVAVAYVGAIGGSTSVHVLS